MKTCLVATIFNYYYTLLKVNLGQNNERTTIFNNRILGYNKFDTDQNHTY